MFDEYPVYCDEKEVGSVHIKKLGLYACFDGAAQLPHKGLWRAICFCDDQRVDLGICLFDGKSYIVRKQLPEKYLKGTHFRFEVINEGAKNKEIIRVSDSSEETDSDDSCLESESDRSAVFLDSDHVF